MLTIRGPSVADCPWGVLPDQKTVCSCASSRKLLLPAEDGKLQWRGTCRFLLLASIQVTDVRVHCLSFSVILDKAGLYLCQGSFVCECMHLTLCG